MGFIKRISAALCGFVFVSVLASAASFQEASHSALKVLETELKKDSIDLRALSGASDNNVPLTKKDAQRAIQLLGAFYKAQVRKERQGEMEKQILSHGELKMPFFTKVYGEAPAKGRSLFISMHGGGNAPPRINDRQWENQKGLYQPDEGVYVAPRAPTDSWNLWHQAHVDWFFERLIQNMIVFHDVNPNRVYLMGYSAGGDGVYQLAPRMADYFAAAAMMAGHPNETSPIGLRNLPFALFMGGKDAAYKRNQVAADWGKQLAALQSKDPDGYTHWVKIFPDHGHWMQKEDAAGVPWMHRHTRRQYPNRIVWKQDDVRHERFYWLKASKESTVDRAETIVSLKGQIFQIEKSDEPTLTIRLNDVLLDMDQPIKVVMGDSVLFEGKVTRTIQSMIHTLLERGDPSYVFSGSIELELGEKE